MTTELSDLLRGPAPKYSHAWGWGEGLEGAIRASTCNQERHNSGGPGFSHCGQRDIARIPSALLNT